MHNRLTCMLEDLTCKPFLPADPYNFVNFNAFMGVVFFGSKLMGFVKKDG